MAAEILYSPQAPVRWAHLINARETLDPSKPKAFTCELLLSGSNPKHVEFLAKLDDLFTDTHGARKKRSDKGTPWKTDREDPSITIVKFKSTEFVRDDGSKAAGPRIIDSRKQPWDGSEIGNGSQVILAFTIYGWERPEGTGLSLQPKAAQVVTFVPRADLGEAATDGFSEQEGGYSVAQPAGFVDEFGDEAPF
jgi:hypothetical protein